MLLTETAEKASLTTSYINILCIYIQVCILHVLSHPGDPVLKFLVCWVGSPGKLERLLSLLLAHLPQLTRELVVFLIPRVEHTETLGHHLVQ